MNALGPPSRVQRPRAITFHGGASVIVAIPCPTAMLSANRHRPALAADSPRQSISRPNSRMNAAMVCCANRPSVPARTAWNGMRRSVVPRCTCSSKIRLRGTLPSIRAVRVANDCSASRMRSPARSGAAAASAGIGVSAQNPARHAAWNGSRLVVPNCTTNAAIAMPDISKRGSQNRHARRCGSCPSSNVRMPIPLAIDAILAIPAVRRSPARPAREPAPAR